MTCSSCAANIEKNLNKLDGVSASVNYATEKAHVTYPDSLQPEALVAAIESTGYSAKLPSATTATTAAHTTATTATTTDPTLAADPATAAARQRLIVCTVLTVPVVLMSMIPFLQFTYWQWAALTLASPVVVWGALPFHRAAWLNAKHRTATMDTLISIGVSAAYIWSLWALFFGGAGQPGMHMSFSLLPTPGAANHEIYLEVAAGVTVFLLAGKYMEARAKRRSSAALQALLSLGAKDVTIVRGDDEVLIPISQLTAGDVFIVRPGEKVATDGEVVSGSSTIDAALVTGESMPIEVSAGDSVTGATLNLSGRLIVRATSVGADTQLAQIIKLVESAQTGKAHVQRLADKVSAVFVPIVLLLSLATLIGWFVTGNSANLAFSAAVAVLIIACPCALGLATPTALLVGTGRGAQLGILIKGPQVLESTRRINTIVLDKTGTVTTGQMSVGEVIAAAGHSADEVLTRAASVERASAHPIALAITAAVNPSEVAPVHDFLDHGGLGVSGKLPDATTVLVGRKSWVAKQLSASPEPDVDQQVGTSELDHQARVAESNGQTPVWVAWGGKTRGVITIADTIKPTSAAAVTEFRTLGLTPVLLTGDNPTVAENVAKSVGISDVVAGVLPAGKVEVVANLQTRGDVVAMVGDGVNDAPALATADLGIAMSGGTDAAIEAADITLLQGDLRLAAGAIRLSRATLGTIKGNLFWAFAYNVAAIPLAMAGMLNPLIAGAAMAASSLFVVTNSLRLRRFRLAQAK